MIFYWLKAKIEEFRSQSIASKRNQKNISQIEEGAYRDAPTLSNSKFNDEYDLACGILKRKLNEHFPDNYHASSCAGYDPQRNYSFERSEAIDKSSSVISRALRTGAGVNRAVELGLKSIGL